MIKYYARTKRSKSLSEKPGTRTIDHNEKSQFVDKLSRNRTRLTMKTVRSKSRKRRPNWNRPCLQSAKESL